MTSALQEHLEPIAFIRTTLTLDAAEFARHWGATVFLVKLEDAKGTVATALRARATAPSYRSPKPIGAEPSILVEDHTGVVPPLDPWPESGIAHQVRARLARGPYFAVALRPRLSPANSLARWLSVGRRRDSDLLLAAPNVSKRHASLQLGAGGRCDLIDLGSRNGTRVNGTAVVPQQAVTLAPGDIVCFGATEGVFCPTYALWTALRLGGS